MKRVILALILALSVPYPAMAVEYFFNPHFIITDEEARDYRSMSLSQIQQFLKDKGSGLASRSFTDFEGNVKPAAEIIWQAAVEMEISPKLILATLQKEQSLIGEANPSQRQLDRAMGYRCPDDGVCNPTTLDFGKQVDGAVWQFSQYFEKPNDWFYKIGQQYDVDGYLIMPSNQATANLYNYTPHYSGNNHFWRIWQDFWGKNFPDGSFLKANNSPGVWLIQYGTKRLITSWGVLLSRFDPNKILTVSQTDLEKYELGPSIKFYNYSLLSLPDGKVYLLVDDELRYITSPEVFRMIGFNPEEIEFVEEADLAGYKYGRDITTESAYPTGALLQDNQSGGVYFVDNGVKRPIYSREIMDANFKNKILTTVAPEIFDQYQTGLPLKFKDGELIKAKDDPRVYVISDGYRRFIKSEEAFANLGYKWDNIITTSEQAVNVHPLGEEI